MNVMHNWSHAYWRQVYQHIKSLEGSLKDASELYLYTLSCVFIQDCNVQIVHMDGLSGAATKQCALEFFTN